VAALLVLYWRVTGSFHTHYLVAAGVLAAAALAALPIQEAVRPYVEGKLTGLTVYMGAVGVIYAVAGVLDHRNLVSLLGGGGETAGDAGR